MKTTLKTLLNGILILLSIFLLGIFFPILVSLLLIINTNISLEECIITNTFWIFTIVGWFVAAIFMVEQFIKNK